MMKYECIFPNFYETEAWKQGEDMGAYYEAQNACFSVLFPKNRVMIGHWFDSPFYDEGFGKVETAWISDAVDMIAIKDGANLVRFENGNIGFVGYYNGIENGFELVDPYQMAFDLARFDIGNERETDEEIWESIKNADVEMVIECLLESVTA